MFKKALAEKFELIFDFKKVSFDQPNFHESGLPVIEQETLFVTVDTCTPSIKDGRSVAKVMGHAECYTSTEKLPFGYFVKRIDKSGRSLTKDLFFYEIEHNTKVYQNLVQRGFSFVYFFDSQYDPDTGSITSIAFEET